MKVSLTELLSRIPGAPSEQWPAGERYALAFEHGSMSVGFYAPVGHDPQQPHQRDEIYIIHSGTGDLLIGKDRHNFAPGDVFFVGSGIEHRFENFSSDFSSWVVFWGPAGGEK
jgi:mannose-6-phosphate isomerase-like protein (cupin superfamily)